MTLETEVLLMLFIYGACSGSFFNLIGMRVPAGESISFPRSHCSNCKHVLQWYELIPILSWVLLRGKCKKCKTHISIIHPTMELITGLLFSFAFYKFGFHLATVYAILIISLGIIISTSDISYGIIPNKILLFFAIILIPISITLINWKDQLFGLLAAVVLIGLMLLLSKGNGIGGGDIKLFLLLSVLLGWQIFILMFFMSTIVGMIYGLYFKYYKKKGILPFGPAIAIATIICLFYGDRLIEWYTTLIQ